MKKVRPGSSRLCREVSVRRFETGVATFRFLFFLNYFLQTPAVTL
ncbi:MAG TPA: hypothetical protein VL122_10710 [Nitrospirota bacterium]|nr:hypothetical protein [Nitrospirota bacterium]